MNNNMPDYKNYTLGDLFQARDAIDRDAYPERLAEIENQIHIKMTEPKAEEVQRDKILSKYQTFWRRFLALFVDSLALGIVYIALFKLLEGIGWWTVPVALIFQYFYFLGYSVVCHGLYGKTLGKLATGIVVLDAKTEGKIGFKHALLRDSVPLVIAMIVFSIAMFAYLGEGYLTEGQQNLVMWVGIFELIWILLELITMLFNDKRRALHDYIGQTVVIKENC